MRLIDSNIHLPPAPSLEHEIDLTVFDIHESLKKIRHQMQNEDYIGGNIMILDTSFLRQNDATLINELKLLGLRSTVMVNPLDEDAYDCVDIAFKMGVGGIKFHPYILGLTDDHFPITSALAKYISQREMWIAVDCSYGTKNLYTVSGVRLVNILSDVVKTPIIALHGGGKLVLDIMSIAMEAKQIYIDLSFSIPFWLGSSVETDFAFAIKKIGSDRFMYGSDYPYIGFDQASESVVKFLDNHGVSKLSIDDVMFGTAAKVFNYELS
jgi:uncharacterized protein